MIFISIIIPVYNKEKYISLCIDSVLGQTYKHFELILVNDGSTDCSGEICNQYAANDKRIRVINQKNGGASHARNVGIQNAKGEYITFIDADDMIREKLLEYLSNAIIKNDADIAICGFELRDCNSGDLVKVCIIESEFSCNRDEFVSKYFYEAYKSDAINSISNKMYRKSIIEQNNLQYNEKYYIQEDRIFILQFLSKCNTITNVNKSLYCYVINIKDSLAQTFSETDILATWSLFNILSNFLVENNADEKTIKYTYSNMVYIFISRIVVMYHSKVIKAKEKLANLERLNSNQEFQSLLQYAKPANIKYSVLFLLLKRRWTIPIHIIMRII